MTRISMKEAMVISVATSTAAFFAWLYYSTSNGFYVWVTFPPLSYVVMAIISMVSTFTFCFWRHNRKIGPVD